MKRLIPFIALSFCFPLTAFAQGEPGSDVNISAAQCGNTECEVGETKETCPKDCDPGERFINAVNQLECGNGACEDVERRTNSCPRDCAGVEEKPAPDPNAPSEVTMDPIKGPEEVKQEPLTQ